MATLDSGVDLDHLEEHGYCVIRNFLPDSTCDELRAHMDSLLPPIAPPSQADVRRVNIRRHPIPGDIMPRLAANPDMLDLAAAIVHSQPDDLLMLEQVIIRTDPVDPPYGDPGWHIDMAFHQREYDVRPRRTYFHCVHALDDVVSGQAATHIVPGSHHLSYAATRDLKTHEELDAFKADAIQRAGIDLSKAIEICPGKGDLLVFNPMCLHAASANRASKPRYVYFASYMDRSAADLTARIKATNYHPHGYADAFRDALPEHRRHLVTWWPATAPESGQASPST